MLHSPSMSIYSIIGTFTRKPTTLKHLLILICAFGIFLYIIDASSLRWSHLRLAVLFGEEAEENRKWDWKFMEELDDEYQQSHPAYFLDTEGCRMPSFNVVDENVAVFLTDKSPIHCGRPLIRSNNNYLWIDLNETEIKIAYGVKLIDTLKCEYQPFQRKNDLENEFPKRHQKVSFRYGDVVRIPEEFIRVICRVKGRSKEIYLDYHFFVRNKAERKRNQRVDAEIKADTANPPMSVMVIGIDAVSRLNFHRRMNETVDVLLNELNAVELFGFNKVADNTYPNLIPVLTGLDENELITACIPAKNDTFDRCNFIWKSFKDKNYLTAFVEDMAKLALFNFVRRGFDAQPTDYYLRPILMEMEHHIANHEDNNSFLCLGKRRTFDVFLEYAQKLLSMMAERLHFSFFWSISYTHDFLNYPKLIDTALANFLRSQQTTGALDNLFLILMSDHGIRWGSFRNTYQGMMEERQPFVFFVPPKRFAHKYPQAMRNLVQNRRRLTTPFDLYETMRDLAQLDTLEGDAIKRRSKELEETEPLPRGISLFLPVPPTRTCYNAAIAPHWCTCHEKAELSVNEARVETVARLIVDHMNDFIQPYPECHRLRLNAIFSANLGVSNANFRNISNHFEDITVHIETKPGLGQFEGTVRVYENHIHELAGAISRTNLYGDQSACVQDAVLKLYCFCGSRM